MASSPRGVRARRRPRSKSEPGLVRRLRAELSLRIREPARLLRALANAWQRLRTWWRRWILTTLFTLVTGAAAVAGAFWFSLPSGPAGTQPPACDDGTFRQATVVSRIQVDVEKLEYPRITSDLEISVPRDTLGAELLLSNPDAAAGRAAFSCVLGKNRSELEVREAPPMVVTRDGAIVVTQRSYVDVVNTSDVWVDFAHIEVNTSNGLPWVLTVYSPWGLRYAEWNVTLAAPAGWLATPYPSRRAELVGAQLHWPNSAPTASRNGNLNAPLDYRVVSAELRPDTRSAVSAAATDRRHKPFAWGAYWLSALVFALFVRWALRAPRGQVQFESSASRRARRAARSLPYLIVMAGVQAVTDAVLPASSARWPDIAWTAAGALLVVATWMALRWWTARVAATLLLATGIAALVAARPSPSAASTWWDDAGTVVLAFVITLLFVVGVGKALLVLLREQLDTPRWLWCVSAALSSVLVVEELVLHYVNNQRQQWLDAPQLRRDIAQLYRYYPLDLLDEMAWLALLVGAAAVWRRYASHWFERGRQSPMPIAIALFAVGPLWWDVHLWGVWWWAWVVGAIPLMMLWLLLPRLWKPLLEHPSVSGADLEPARLRDRATQWYADRTKRGPVPSPVHVLVAVGPSGSPMENMRTAVKFASLPSLIAGTGLLITEWVMYPQLSINQQDSMVLKVVDAVGWEVAKWLLAAAALGLSWQHLPGKRGLIKALPMVLTYATVPVGQFLVNRASNGVPDWVPLADAALFALVVLFVALRLDFSSQADVQPRSADQGRIRRTLAAFGLSDIRGHLAEMITLVAALLAIWTALTGGEVTFPSIDPGQFSRK